MMMRKIIEIDEDLCDGCGICIPNCVEGALKIVDGKARMISDLFCDGLGACLGHCPQGAIRIIEREAEPYDEWRVMERIVRGGPSLIREHLEHMEAHGEEGYLKIARDFLSLHGIPDPTGGQTGAASAGGPAIFQGCPGSAAFRLARQDELSEHSGVSPSGVASAAVPTRSAAGIGRDSAPGDSPKAQTTAPTSELGAWPVQLHLINPDSAAFQGAQILLAADCAAYAAGDFHPRYLKGHALAIACPKLDSGLEIYREKLAKMMGQAAGMTVLMMEVACCGGLLKLALEAREMAGVPLPISLVVLNVRGEEVSRCDAL